MLSPERCVVREFAETARGTSSVLVRVVTISRAMLDLTPEARPVWAVVDTVFSVSVRTFHMLGKGWGECTPVAESASVLDQITDPVSELDTSCGERTPTAGETVTVVVTEQRVVVAYATRVTVDLGRSCELFGGDDCFAVD